MSDVRKLTSLVCMNCAARGKAQWNSEGPDYRREGIAELSRGFRYVDRGPQYGSHFVCVACNIKVTES